MIKYYRTQKKMTQAELAKGICSVPHLSKIENNFKEANKDTVSLLLRRLDIDFQEVEKKEEQINILLRELKNKMSFYLKDKIDEAYQSLTELEHLIPFSKHIYTWELYKFRYFIFVGDIARAEQHKDLLAKQKKNFSQHEAYLFRYYNAIFLIWKGQYKAADEVLESLYNEPDSEVTEGEFLYHRALVKSSLEQSGHAIHFGKLALQIYMNQHNFLRILHTLMLLGINYTHSKIYEEAEGCYQHLIRNAELLKVDPLLPQIYHNMGDLKYRMKNAEEALFYYEKSLALQSPGTQNYLLTILSIGELYLYSLHQKEKAKQCFQRGIQLAQELGLKKYKLFSKFYLLHIDSAEKAFRFLEFKVIPYLEEMEQPGDDLKLFFRMLADYYNKKGRVIEAIHYLNKLT